MRRFDASRYDDAMARPGFDSVSAFHRDRAVFEDRLYPASDREWQSHVWLSLRRTLATFAVAFALVVVLIASSY